MTWRPALLERWRLSAFEAALRDRLPAAVIAIGAGLVVFGLAHEVFPYHSVNHDEGVYLQSAAMLLEGRLFLTPGSEALRAAVHPWFFVESDHGLYPKYAPVPAAMFALGKLAGGYRLALGAIAAANVAFVAALGTETFDRRTGLLAALLFAAAPLFLLTSAVFLPYAPTTALTLLFALAYVRAVRRADRRYAALAGLAIGLAFFARPYTAVLFAAPFIVHAVWRLVRRRRVGVIGIVAGLGFAGVGVTFAYNDLMTGSVLLFPYEAFAPADGLGFGRREILRHRIDYTPSLALEASGRVLWALATDWYTAGPLGILAALAGVAMALRRLRRAGVDFASPIDDTQLVLLWLGLAVSVILGNVYFWGNYNILGDLGDPTDGFISLFGPFYHFDVLLPLSLFAAHGIRSGGASLQQWLASAAPRRTARVAFTLCLVGGMLVFGATDLAAMRGPIERHAAMTDEYERAYAPLEHGDLSNALVFVPPTLGPWRNHPFQWLRNDPGLDGSVVYAMTLSPENDFAVLSAYPGRTPYRYRYHGVWTSEPDQNVVPVLERLERRAGINVTARTTVTVPERIVRASVAVSNGEEISRYDLPGDPPDELAIVWRMSRSGVEIMAPEGVPRGENQNVSVPIDGADEVVLTVTITEPGGGTLTYREAVRVRTTASGVEAIWPPASSVCLLVTACDSSGTYVPDRPETRPDGIAMNTTLVTPSPE